MKGAVDRKQVMLGDALSVPCSANDVILRVTKRMHDHCTACPLSFCAASCTILVRK